MKVKNPITLQFLLWLDKKKKKEKKKELQYHKNEKISKKNTEKVSISFLTKWGKTRSIISIAEKRKSGNIDKNLKKKHCKRILLAGKIRTFFG